MHVETTRLARLRSVELAPRRFRRLAYAATALLWAIVSTGAVVRLTGSGLGCEHWPGCEPGRPFPEKDYHAYIEFGNRLVGGVTIAATIALALGAWFVPGLPRWARKTAVWVCVGSIAQAPLGAITVYAHLHPLLVIPHLLLSIAVLGGAVVLSLEARRSGPARAAFAREPRLIALAITAACFVLVVSGTFATAAGPHSGGKHVHRIGTLDVALIAHGATVAVFGLGLIFLLGYLLAIRERSYLLGGLGLAGLVGAQMALGDVQYRTHLPWWLVLVHVAIAATVWAWTVAFATLLWRPVAGRSA